MPEENKNPIEDRDNLSALYTIWSIQDSLLQSYRTIFITSESFLIGIAASMASRPTTTNLSQALALVGLTLLYSWVKVTRSRSRDVSFAQQMIKWHEIGKTINNPMQTFKSYQKEYSEKNWIPCHLKMRNSRDIHDGRGLATTRLQAPRILALEYKDSHGNPDSHNFHNILAGRFFLCNVSWIKT